MKIFMVATFVFVAKAAVFAQGDHRTPPGRVEVPMPGRVVDLKLSESRIACLLSSGDVQIVARDDGRLIANIRGDGLPSSAVALSSDGDWVAIGRVKEMVPSGFGLITTPPSGNSPKLALAGSATRTLSQESAERANFFGLPRPRPSTDRVLRIPYGGVVTIRRISDEDSARSRADFSETIAALELDDSSLAIVGTGLKCIYTDKSLNIQYYYSGNLPLHNNLYPHQNLVFAPDRKRFAFLVGNSSGNIEVAFFDANLRRCVTLTRPVDSPPPWALAMSPDGRTLVACGPGNSVALWDLEGGAPARVVRDGRAAPCNCYYVAFAGNSRQLLTFDDAGAGRLWDIENDRVIAKFKVPKRNIRALSYSDNILTLISGAYHYQDETIEPLLIQTIQVLP